MGHLMSSGWRNGVWIGRRGSTDLGIGNGQKKDSPLGVYMPLWGKEAVDRCNSSLESCRREPLWSQDKDENDRGPRTKAEWLQSTSRAI